MAKRAASPDGSPSGLAPVRAFRLWVSLLDLPRGDPGERCLEEQLRVAVEALNPLEMADYAARVVSHLRSHWGYK